MYFDKEAIDYLVSLPNFLGYGRNRLVLKLSSGKNVIKIPLNEEGVSDNYRENRYAKVNGWLDHSQKARCRMFGYCLVMEYVEPTYEFEGLPNWTGAVDCQQVGYTSDGRLVAYDFA